MEMENIELHRTVFTWTIYNFSDRAHQMVSNDEVHQNKIVVNTLSFGDTKDMNKTFIYMGHKQEIHFDIYLHAFTSAPGELSIEFMVHNTKTLSKVKLQGYVILSNGRLYELMNERPKFFENHFAAVRVDIHMSNISNANDEILPNDALTVVCACDLYYKIQNPEEMIRYHYDLSAAILFLASYELQSLFENRGDSDVTVSCEGAEFEAHKAILSFHSAVFASMFEQETKKETEVIVIEDVEKYIMIMLLDYMYGNDIFDMRFRTIIAIYSAANKYAILDLIRYSSKILEMCLTFETVCELTLLAQKNKDDELFDAAEVFSMGNCHEFNKCEFFKEFAEKLPEIAQSLVIRCLMFRE